MSDAKSQIQNLLDELEQEEQIRLLFVCESGSRAWGFESKDSDYDVRFVYARPKEWYLAIDEGRDVIERPIDNDIDLSGWDIKKALKLLRKSNPPLLEWLQSPIIYREHSQIAGWLREEVPLSYSPTSCMYHYLHMAQGNFREYLRKDEVRVKKYFYVLRPVLACLWIERDKGPVPMEFETLLKELVSEGPLYQEISTLLERKKDGEELDRGPVIPLINEFLGSEIERLGVAIVARTEKTERTSALNILFRNILDEVW
jgi:predicted nucleotidyltransferase